MMNYKKGKNVEEELTKDAIPIENLPQNFLWMHVKGGTKVSNVVDFAKKAFDSKERRSVVWSGSGGGVTKTISCAEIMKRDSESELHQITRLCYRKVEEFWEPQLDGLEQIVATRQIPCIHILLSLDKIDETASGLQNSKEKTTFWVEHPQKSSSNNQNKRKNQQKPTGSGFRNKGGSSMPKNSTKT
ncbi:ribonuclease P protein subunit p25-like protein isoform X2 [Bradysia coprophila]|uniref:ribonuclease P protein subunit p25-like protein isoform X2 n=1 Tax=Bradysia coprophila TaxID=38358 RepID=UPI00187D9B16|nr:ribonuclease P protein subunit p25-like protein isoform X2 [Bradysia coprophila]XP_037046157.1 ribonuclease P protein subunit p25-like protein isoform X2 [Bradysia coprophila]